MKLLYDKFQVSWYDVIPTLRPKTYQTTHGHVDRASLKAQDYPGHCIVLLASPVKTGTHSKLVVSGFTVTNLSVFWQQQNTARLCPGSKAMWRWRVTKVAFCAHDIRCVYTLLHGSDWADVSICLSVCVSVCLGSTVGDTTVTGLLCASCRSWARPDLQHIPQ